MTSHVVDEWIEPIFEIRCERGRYGINMNEENAKFFAEDADGNGIDEDFQNSIKITKMLQTILAFRETGVLPEIICDGITARPHLVAINSLAFGAPIHDFPQDVIKEYDNDEYQGYFVSSIGDAIYECYMKDAPLSASDFTGILPEAPVKSYEAIKDSIDA